jgi:hypothetical protein
MYVCSSHKTPVILLMKLEFCRQIFEKCHENPFNGSRVVLCRPTDRQTDKTKLTDAFCNFASAYTLTVCPTEHIDVLGVNRTIKTDDSINGDRSSSVNAVTRLRDGRLRNLNSTPGWVRGLLLLQKSTSSMEHMQWKSGVETTGFKAGRSCLPT